MSEMTLELAQTLIASTQAYVRDKKLQPLCIAVLDSRGALVAYAGSDGAPLMRWKVAVGKAWGAVAFGAGSRRLGAMSVERPHFVGALTLLADGGMVPVAGGVLVRDAHRKIIGAVGTSGDTSDNDEAAAAAAITQAGLIADGG